MKAACIILAISFGLGGLLLTRTVGQFIGCEHELMILAIGTAFLACGYFFGIVQGMKNKERNNGSV